MDFREKAQIKMEHWIEHNDKHIQEYEEFARELDNEGHTQAAAHVRELAELTGKSSQSLRQAVAALG